MRRRTMKRVLLTGSPPHVVDEVLEALSECSPTEGEWLCQLRHSEDNPCVLGLRPADACF